MTYYEYLQNNEVKLFTVISLPDRKGFFPVVIYRSPYVDSAELLSEDEICAQKAVEYQKWNEAGYAVVFQHCRGRGKSSGDCVPYIYERDDGLFLQSWIRKQSFYNGELYLSFSVCKHYTDKNKECELILSISESTHFVPASDYIKLYFFSEFRNDSVCRRYQGSRP